MAKKDTSPLAMGRMQKGSAVNKKKKKDEEERKAVAQRKPQSSSVSKPTQQQRQNQKTYGTTQPRVTQKQPTPRARTATQQRSVDPKEARRQESARNMRAAATRFASEDRRTAAQAQKMNMPTAEEQRRSRENMRAAGKAIGNTVRESLTDESKARMQRQKSGIQTEEDKRYNEQRNQRRIEVAKNTGRAAKKGVQDTLTGYGKTLADIDEMAKSSDKWTEAKSMKLGIDKDDTVGRAKVEEERQKSIKEARRLRLALGEKQEKRQQEFDEATKNAKGLEKAWYGAVESGAGMATDMAVGAATGTGQVGALASMGIRSYGATRGQAEKEGATENEDRLYSLLQAGKEVGTEMMFQGAGLAKSAFSGGKVGLSLADRAANSFTRNMTGRAADATAAGIRLLGGTAEENAEEFAGWLADPVIKELTYGRNVRQREAKAALKQESDAIRANITSEEDARSAAAYLNSDRFIEDYTQQYKDAGLKDSQAREAAEQMREYLTASLSGDIDRMAELEDDIAQTVGGKFSDSVRAVFGGFDKGELMDTLASTSLLTLTTGLPAGISTAARGSAIRDSLGTEGLRALSETAINFEDGVASLKAQAARDRIDEGKELTSTQVYDLAQAQAQQVEKDFKRSEAASGVAETRIKNENYVMPELSFGRDGSVAGDEIIAANYVKESNAATDIIEDLMEQEGAESLTDTEVQNGSRAIAGFKTGAFTIADANALNYTNTTVRTAFSEATGVDLNQYVVKDKQGKVDIPKTNAATKDALFAMAADNFVKTAEAETANWMDNVKGEVVTEVTSRMGAQGSVALQAALDDVDERDRSTYMLQANAADMMYQTARNMGTEWDTVKAEAKSMFPGVSEDKLRDMYNAGLRDREAASTRALGKQTKIGETIDLSGESEAPKGNVYIDTEYAPKGSVVRVFSEIATNLGVDIHLVDDLKTRTGTQANGQYINGAIYINVRSDFEKNVGYIFMHEVTHHLKLYAPEQFNALENLVRERWFSANPEEMQNEISKRIDLYRRNGQNLPEEEALEEIIADAAHEFINDSNFARQTAETDPSLAKAVLDSIRNALRAIRRILALSNLDDETHMNTLFSQLGILDEAERLWLDAYTQAVKNKAAVGLVQWDEDARNSVGFHAGDLGKSTVDDYAHQGYGRGTGHFGFGTYFVGDEEQINFGDYGKRKHETVDFDKYNLFRPRDFEQGLRLHDALKLVDGFITEFSEFNQYDRLSGEGIQNSLDNTVRINRAAENLVDDYEWEDYQWNDNSLRNKEKVDKYIAEKLDDYDRNEIERKARQRYDEEQNKKVDEESIRKELAHHYDTFKDMKDFWGDPFISETSEEEYIQNNLEDTIRIRTENKNIPYDYYYYKEAQEAIKGETERWDWKDRRLGSLASDLQFALGFRFSEERITEALKETERIVRGYKHDPNYSRLDVEPGLDSGATVFMKQLGYEGVDVRHISEMDNTGYGSVIYDLKGEDLARKQEIGTARFSLSEDMKPGEVRDFKSGDEDVRFSIREEAPPTKTEIGYKVFFVKDGKLYPPMVANPGGADTPIGVWLNADEGTRTADSKTGRPQVKAGGKGTQGSSGSLAYRPGWHLGTVPVAHQFDRLNPENGKKELFPAQFVWAECEIAADVDYQEEAMSYGYTESGKFRHSYAGLPKLPKDGFYRYRTNPDPKTEEWMITGAMKVNRLLSDEEVNQILAAQGREPVMRQGGNKTLAELGLQNEPNIRYSISFNDKSFDELNDAEQGMIHEAVSPDIRFSMPTERDVLPKARYKSDIGFSNAISAISGKQARINALVKNGFSEEQAKQIGEAISNVILDTGNWIEGDLQSEFTFIGWDDLINAEVSVRKDWKGKVVGVSVSAMVANGEYPVNFDLTTICNKREGIMQVIQNLTRIKTDTGKSVLDSVKLTDQDMWNINKALKAEGIDTACLGCFVEARRYYTNRFIASIDNKWNTAVRETRRQFGLPEEEYFNFAHGKKVTGEDYTAISDLWTSYEKSKDTKKSPEQRIRILMNEIIKNNEVDSPYLKLVSASDILTPEGISGLKQISTGKHDLVKTLKSIYGTSAPKEILAFTPYNSEIALLPKNLKGQRADKYLRSIGGIRIQSFSDFKIEHVIDHMQMVADMAARKFTCHAYSKVIAFPRIFGLTGQKINMSVMFDITPAEEWQTLLGCSEEKAKEYAFKYAGLRFVTEKPAENPDNRPYIETDLEGVHGYLTYLLGDADYINSVYEEEYQKNIAAGMDENEARRKANEAKPFEQSINYREAVELENQEGYKENVGIIAVAYGDEHLKILLADPNVRYVIPYHKSGLPVFVSEKTSLQYARNYEPVQNTKKADPKEKLQERFNAFKEEYKGEYPAIAFFGDIYENGGSIATTEATATEAAKLHGTGEFDVYKDLDKAKDIKEVANAYLEDCIEKNLVPVFSEFAGDPNYYKMLFDFAVTDGTSDHIYPQKTVRNNYPGIDVDAKIAAGEEVTEDDYAKLREAIRKGASEENAKNQTRSENMKNVLDDILSKDSENSILAGTNVNAIRDSATDYTDPKGIKYSITPEMDEAYIDAVNSGNMEEAQRLVDEAAERAGYTTRAFHGTPSYGFTEFDIARKINGRAFGDGIYLTNIREAAEPYASERKEYDAETKSLVSIGRPGIYSLFVKTGEDALDFDYENFTYNGRKVGPAGRMPMIQMDIEANPNKDVIVRNINDGSDVKSTVYVIKDAGRVKSSDAVTYADDGSVIPLSERFDPKKTDIRYSLPTQDADGKVLTNGQMEYFKNSMARDAQGRLVRAYHTTNYGGFTVFDPSYSDDKRSLFFASNFDVSQTYGTRRAKKPIDLNPNLEPEKVEYKALTEQDLMKIVNKYGDFRVFTKDEYDSYVPATQESYQGYRYKEDKAEAFGKKYGEDVNWAGGYRLYAYLEDLKAGNIGSEDYVLAYYDRPGHVYAKGNSLEELLNNLSQREYDEAVRKAEEDFRQKQVDAKSGYYTCYLNLENPLIVDAEGAPWHSIPFRRTSSRLDQAVEEMKAAASLGLSEVQIDFEYNDESWPIAVNLYVVGQRKVGGEWKPFTINDSYSVDPADTIFDEWGYIDYPEMSAKLEAWAMKGLEDLGVSDGFIDSIFTDHENAMSGGYEYETTNATGFDWFNEGQWIPEDEDLHNEFNGMQRYGTRDLAEIAEEQGYDGVIIRNCRDIGGASRLKVGASSMSDIYIAFSSNQIKDINNENPTENPDIRYSITPEDEGMSKLAYEDAMDDSYEALARYEEMLDDPNAEQYFSRPFKEEDVTKFFDSLRAEDAVPSADPSFEEDRVRRAKSKAEFYNSVNAKWNDRWTTEGEVLDLKSVKKDIKNLVMGVMANSDTDAQYRNKLVRQTLLDVRTAYQLMKQDRTDVASYLLFHSAQRMIEGVEFIEDDTAFQEYKGIRDYLRTYRINAPEEFWENESFLEFRKEYYGRLRIGKGESNIEDVYKDLQDNWPHIFNEEQREKKDKKDKPWELLQHIGVVVDSNVTPFMEAYSSEEAMAVITETADALYDIMAGGKEVVSLADSYKQRFDEKTKAMKQRHAEAILRMRKAKEEGIKKERQKFREYKERQKEKKAHSVYFDRIKDTHDKLVERLTSNTADKHIPEQYKKELAKLLAAFDLQTEGSKAREARTGHVAQKTIKMAAIRSALKNIEDRSELFHVNDAVTDIMDSLSVVDGQTIDSLSAAELSNIDKLLRALLHEFNRYEKVKVGVKNMQAADLASAQTVSALEHAKLFGPGNDYYGAIGWLDKIINMDEVTPAYMFRRIDPNNTGLGLMWKEIRRSQDKYIRNTDQIQKWMDEITGKYKNKGRFNKKYGSDTIEQWRSTNYQQTFNVTNGSVTLTPAQAMSLYCLSKRNQAYGHMVGAGIVVAPVSFQAKLMSDLKRKINRSMPVILTDADIKTIVSSLTPEQIKVADQLQELMSTKMADMGNEASMNVLGIKLFNERDYFPIKSDKAALERDLSNEEFESAIRNFGFTKAVQPGARNAIMVEDIFDVVAEHCNNMNLYNSYSETLNDFMKVFNKHTIMEDGADYSVRQALAHAYSNKVPTYIMEFIRDINGNVSKGRQTGIDNAMSDMLGRAKQASVFANIRVLLQQPTAITRAFAVIDPKYLKGVSMKDVAKGSIPTVTTEVMQEMFEHCPIALWKSWGYYDINMGRSIEAVIMNEGNFLEDLATQAYGKADNVTWAAIWQMVKEEAKDLHPELKEGTSEFFEHCNERMSEIVDLTQVVDSPLHRSHLMRSKQVHHKILTAFMSEPTLTFNMLHDGLIRAREAWKKGNKAESSRIIGRIGGVAVLQATTVAAAAAIADALRGKGGDDDDDKGFGELWLLNFIENLKDEAKVWNKIYYVKDLASIAEGWDNANLALQGWKSLCDGFRQLDKKLFEGSKTPWWKIYYNLLGGLGYFTGIPFKTLMKDGRSIFEMLGGELPESLVGEEKTSGIISSDSKLNSLRLFNSSDSDSSVSSIVRVDTGDKWYDYENNPITVRDGSALDKILNHFGINLTASEKAAAAASQLQKARDKTAEEIRGKYANLSGEERDKKVWSAVTTYFKGETEDSKAFSDMVTSGDYASINAMRRVYLAAGGEAEYFDERVLAESKKALKKTLKYGQTAEEIDAQANIQSYLTSHGMTEDEVSDIIYKSDVAKDMKVAFRLGDKDLMLESLEPLVNAGLTYNDLVRLWDNRNRMDLSKYKGRYKDKLKSTGKFIWPTEGVITSHFGYRNAPTAGASSNHPAIDIGAPQGTTVVAADGGTVIYAGRNSGYGNSVGIKHDNGMVTYYNHLYSWNVKVGDTVGQGQQIAQVGSTGISTGPHLDFKILDTNGEPVDPEMYLQKRQ